MERYVISFFCLVLNVLSPLTGAQDQRCSARVTHVNVTSSGGILYSPGYPEEYQNSERCAWLLKSLEVGKVLQLRPLDMHLGRERTQANEKKCTGDVITAHDGRKKTDSVLHKWCGQDTTVVHSTSATVLLRFRSDFQRRYRGFAIKYSLLTLSDNTCGVNYVKTLPLQESGVVVEYTPPPPPASPGSGQTSECSWRLAADDVTKHVVVDLELFDEGLPCDVGNFSVYDGPETSSPEVVNWCSPSMKPFTSVFLSGSQGMVVIRATSDVTSALRFRFYTLPAVFKQCSMARLPTLELKGEEPIYVSFPFAVNRSGDSCPVRILSSSSQFLWARIDVLHMDGHSATCDQEALSSPLVVRQVNETDDENSPIIAQSTCWRGRHPVYWPVAESVVVSLPAMSAARDRRRVLVKVTPSGEEECHGRVRHLTAPSDEALVLKDPPSGTRTLRYSRSAWCRYVISGESETDHVLSNVEGELCELQEHCGDYVRIYDGPSTDSPILYDSRYQHHVIAHVISTGNHVTYEISTDDRANRGFVQAQFNSVPGAELCSDITPIKASRQSGNLSSENYPHYYPINYMCHYCIAPENPDDVIYIDVIDSDMSYSCADSVEVYDGLEDFVEYLGRFCGQDTPGFVSTQPGLCLVFRSDATLHGRGWLLSYRAGPAGPAVTPYDMAITSSLTQSTSSGTTAVVVLAVLLGVITVALIAVVVVLIYKSQKQPTSTV